MAPETHGIRSTGAAGVLVRYSRDTYPQAHHNGGMPTAQRTLTTTAPRGQW
jgi:hypothetical protein